VKAVTAIAARLDDVINPISVKELRQAVQSKFITVMLMLFLLGQVAVVWGSVFFQDGAGYDFDSGRQLFFILMGVLLFTCTVFVPLYAGVRLSSERSDTNVDLFFITTIRPAAIVRGKFFAAMVIAVLIYGACMPFLTFTYLLRGLDLPSIFLTLALGLASTAVAVMLSILIASLALSRIFRVLFGLGLLGALIAIFSSTMSGSVGIVFFGAGSMAGSAEFWGVLGTVTACYLVATGLLYVLAVAALSPPSANRALPLRIYIPIVWLATGIIAWLWADAHGSNEPVLVTWLTPITFMLCVAMFIAVSERNTFSRRMLKRIPRTRLLQPAAFLFFSGSAGGVLWWLVLATATFLVAWAWVDPPRPWTMTYGRGEEHELRALVFALYTFCYCMTALFIVRMWLKRVASRYTWLIALIAMAVGSLVPVLVAFMLDPKHRAYSSEQTAWTYGNPFIALDCAPDYLDACLLLTGMWAVVVGLLNLPWILQQYKEFRPLDPNETALSESG